MTTATSEELCERTWTKEEYYRLGELGFFRSQRVELIAGKILLLPPHSPVHAATITQMRLLLERTLPEEFSVRSNFPLDLGATTEPEADLAVVAGPRRQSLVAHPTTAVLVVEIADGTLDHDRGRKANLYASAGVLDYWIVNLVTPQIEVYRDPVADATQPFGARYTMRTDYLSGGVLTPLAFPELQIPVVNVLA